MTKLGGDFASAISVLQDFDHSHPLESQDALPAVDQPDSCLRLLESGKMLHCYNVDIATATILSQRNIAARLWDMSGPKVLGGYGHNMLEIYDQPSRTWRALDPYYHCYYTIGNDPTPIDFLRLRRALLTAPKSLHIIHYSNIERSRPDVYMFAELCYLAPEVMLHANNDFRWRYEHRYTWLSMLAPVFDALPLRMARGVRMAMLGKNDLRYVIEDVYSPHYPFHLMKWSFGILISIFFFSLVGYIVIANIRSLSPKPVENEVSPVSDIVSS